MAILGKIMILTKKYIDIILFNDSLRLRNKRGKYIAI